jgi:threonine-phosphate decarboxylase
MTVHGGDVYDAARRMGISVEQIIDFSASINPLGLSPRVKQTIRRTMNRLQHYPEPYSSELERTVANHLGVDPESVIAGNGSTELIYLIPRVLRPEKVIILEPTFKEYERACRMSGAGEVVAFGLNSDTMFDVSPDTFVRTLATTTDTAPGRTVVFLCNPNNPTGRLLSRSDVIGIADAAAERACYFVVDEAFIDYCPQESVSLCSVENPYLIVLRSMTKFYAMPGIRIGYCIVHPSLSARLREQKEPWTINTLAQAIAVAALQDRDFEEESLRLMAKEKRFMENGLSRLDISFIPSVANYYLLKHPLAAQIRHGLREKGILVRDCSTFAGLDETYLRVAVRSRKENLLLLTEMARICRDS